MTRTRNYLIGLVAAGQRNACHQALAQISGAFADMFSIAVARRDDDPPQYYATDANLSRDQAARLQAACKRFDVRWEDAGPLAGRRGRGQSLDDMLGHNNLRRKSRKNPHAN